MHKPNHDFLWLNPQDNVVVALRPIEEGEIIEVSGNRIHVNENIMTGHKIAIRPIAIQTMVIKYGEEIGAATTNINVGDHVHVHNVRDITAEIRNKKREELGL